MAKKKGKKKFEVGGVVAETDPRSELIKSEIHKMNLAILTLEEQIEVAENAKVDLLVMRDTLELGFKHAPEQTQYSFAETHVVDASDPVNQPLVEVKE